MAPGDMTEKLSLNWFYLYCGSCICLIGLVVTRQAYKLSSVFRTRLNTTGFYKLDLGAPQKEKATLMLSVLCNAWPSTVSEMLEDTESAHGMVFRSLMVTGCLTAMMCDLGALSPEMPNVPVALAVAIGVVHILRRVVFAMAIGFCFAPSTGRDHGVAAVREVTATPGPVSQDYSRSERLRDIPLLRDVNFKRLKSEERAKMARTTIVGSVHSILAVGMLSLLPNLELVALSSEAFCCAPNHISRALSLNACGIAWCSIVLLRLLHIGAIQLCMGVFSFHFISGFFSPAKHHSFKGFWAEFTACRLFAQLMMLAAVQSWFAWPDLFDMLPFALQVVLCIVTALHIIFCFGFIVPNTLLVLRNVEHSEVQLARMFTRGRNQDATVQQLLDTQLAFIGCVQSELGINKEHDTGHGGIVRQWLFQQLRIMLRFLASYNLPIFQGALEIEHAHVD